jgi:fructose-1,6-bisphosphatase
MLVENQSQASKEALARTLLGWYLVILHSIPKSLHERIPVFFGSTANIASIRDIYKN